MFGKFARLALFLLPLLAACNLNTSADVSNQPITGAPRVQIVSPLPNATYLEGVAVNIQALVTNAGEDIDRVDILVDDENLASLTQPNEAGTPSFSLTQSWPAAGTGTHTITVTAFRSDGTTSEPAAVTITVINQVAQQEETPEVTVEPTDDENGEDEPTPAPTEAPEQEEPEESDEPEEPEDEPTPDVPTATFLTGVNVRRGPDTSFEPPMGSFAANDTSEVLAVNPSRTWYKVRYYNSEGWVFANLMSVSGNVDNLPVDAGPPTPTPVPPTATPVPATATPQIDVNLVAGNITTDPGTPTCGQTFRVFVDIANFGSTTSPGGSIRVEDESNGLVTSTVGVFGEIEPGQTRNFGPIPLTVDTNYGAEHELRFIVDPNNEIAETNEDDNRNDKDYTLQRGDC